MSIVWRNLNEIIIFKLEKIEILIIFLIYFWIQIVFFEKNTLMNRFSLSKSLCSHKKREVV